MPCDFKSVVRAALCNGPFDTLREFVASLPVRPHYYNLFTDKDTFGDRPFCGREPGILLRASSAKVTVDLLFCFKCRDVVIVRNDKRLAAFSQRRDDIQVSMTPASAQKFLRLFQTLFPDDKEMQAVKIE